MNKVSGLGLFLLFSGACSPSAPTVPTLSLGRNVVIEAESTRKSTVVGTHYWLVEKGDPTHLVAFPADNAVFNLKEGFAGSPSVTYRVMVERPGTYYLWVRGKGESGGASVIPGFDGQPLSVNADFIGFFPGNFAWLGGLYNSGKRTVLQIDNAGEHDINFWMYEDGFRFDKFILTSDVNLIPE